jgi:hypothetical protein
VILWANGYIPWNYASFLNYATNCILLQKVGGGYVFIHRSLLEHFTALPINQYNYKTSTTNTSIFANSDASENRSNNLLHSQTSFLQKYGKFLLNLPWVLIAIIVYFIVSIFSGNGTPTECSISTISEIKAGIVKTATFAPSTDCEMMRQLAEEGKPLPTIAPAVNPSP